MIPTTQNQLEDTSGDYVYDAAGNLTQPGPIGGPYVYDAENHLIFADGVTYTYDGDGNRVMKSNGTLYWYGANSASLVESDLNGDILRWYYFFDGQRVARQLTTNEVGFYMTDALGSVRYLGGAATGYSFDYFPFGAPILDSDTGDDRYQFTAKERDSESGLDNFGARYNSSNFGRFLSPDTDNAGATQDAPQSWNAYSYVLNNPLNATDPDGQKCVRLDNGTLGDDGTGGGCPGGGVDPNGNETPDQVDVNADVISLSPSFLQSLRNAANNVTNTVNNSLQTALDWLSAPRNMNCLVGGTAAGAATGALAGGGLGLAGGPFAEITVPSGGAGGALFGGVTGWAIGMNACRTGTGSGGGGNGGTQVTSKTLWRDGKGARIDVENPNPGQRPGQIHYQDGSGKYIYDPATNSFSGAPNRVNQLLQNPDVQSAIQKGLRYLGQ